MQTSLRNSRTYRYFSNHWRPFAFSPISYTRLLLRTSVSIQNKQFGTHLKKSGTLTKQPGTQTAQFGTRGRKFGIPTHESGTLRISFGIPMKRFNIFSEQQQHWIPKKPYSSGGRGDGRDDNKSLSDLRFSAMKLFEMPNWSSLTADYVMAGVDDNVAMAAKGLLASIVERHLVDTDLEMECLIFLLLASVSEESSSHPINEVVSSVNGSSGIDKPKVIPQPRHLDFCMLLILMRVSLDIHSRVNEVTVKPKDTNASSPKIDVLDKLHILVGDILVTSMFRKISELNNPTLLKVMFMAMADSIECRSIILQQSSTSESISVYPDSSEMPACLGIGSSENTHQVHPAMPNGGDRDNTLRSDCDVPQSPAFLGKELSACFDGFFLISKTERPKLRQAAKEFGLLLAQATHRGRSNEREEAETYLNQALARLKSFPECDSKTYLATVSRDFVQSV